MKSLLALRRSILCGQTSVVDALTEQYCALHQTTAHRWGCLTHIFPKKANTSSDPQLPLAGVGLAHKDIFVMNGRLPFCGSACAQTIQARESPVIAALERAGAITLAALALAEFAAGVTGENPHLPEPINPCDPNAVVGGSSSGSAIAVAAGLCLGSIGTDTAGSVRIPAATCGIVGLKPTHRALSTRGCFPLAPSLDTVGVLARSSLDAAYLYACSLAKHVRARIFPDLEIPTSLPLLDAWPAHIGKHLPHKSRIACVLDHSDSQFNPTISQREILVRFAQAFAYFPLQPKIHGLATLVRNTSTILHVESAVAHARALRGLAPPLSLISKALALPGAAIPAPWYCLALSERTAWRTQVLRQCFQHHDILLTPVLPHGVPDKDAVYTQSTSYRPVIHAGLFQWTSFVNYLGLPAIVFPVGHDSSGRPVSIQAIARPWAEIQLLALANHVEQSGAF